MKSNKHGGAPLQRGGRTATLADVVAVGNGSVGWGGRGGGGGMSKGRTKIMAQTRGKAVEANGGKIWRWRSSRIASRHQRASA